MSLFYRSTRDDSVRVTASQAILKGLAPDGGLFVPESIPSLDKSLEELSKMSYKEVAYEVMKLMLDDFTEEELKAFFASIDACKKSPFSPLRCYVIPVIFRLIYTCGLRASEARLLRTNDINLSTGKIFIRESKGWEARIVFVSDDMLDLLCRYDRIIRDTYPDRTAFFPNQSGDYYSKSTLDEWFHEFWDQLPEAAVTKGNPPRVHDFRHTYCVYRLNQWVREHADLNALYPYLSEFMGHSNFADTDYYLTLAEPCLLYTSPSPRDTR